MVSFFNIKNLPICLKRAIIFNLLLVVTSCYWMQKKDYASEYGESHRVNRVSTDKKKAQLHQQAQTIIDNRCVVCHACYDAPCQLKLNSREGIERGANKTPIYNGRRLVAANPSHFFEDEEGYEEWRLQDFYPVLNERKQITQANLDLSVMYKMLQLKNENPNPTTNLLPDSFDLKLVRDQQCPKIEEFDEFEKSYPLWGMPYGLPAIPEKEFSVLEQWIAEGAMSPDRKPLSSELQHQIQRWERLLNSPTLKEKLVARYLYEHLYLADLYFENGKAPQFFRLVRSYTPPGQDIKVMPSRRPYDAPLKPTFYYRLKPDFSTIVAKTHMPYVLNDRRYDYWQSLFYQLEYSVTQLPSYDVTIASNPFIVFEQIPMRSRYKFLLDEAQFSIMNFIKGPVCRGQVALSVINDFFWVVFEDPDLKSIESEEVFLKNNKDLLQFPAYWDSNGRPWSWLALASNQKKYMEHRTAFMNTQLNKDIPIDINIVWNGNQTNPNAALTVFRHFDSATVIKGFAGNHPQTAWLITYPLLERIHYLLVAGFDVNGNVLHQLLTRMYMDFLRMEAEANFLALLPKSARLEVQNEWYLGASKDVQDYFDVLVQQLIVDSKIPFKTQKPKAELLELLTQHIKVERYILRADGLSQKAFSSIARLNNMKGINVSFMAQTSIIEVVSSRGSHWFSLLHHNAYQNKTKLLTENKERTPDQDNLLLSNHIVSAYPNAFFQVEEDELDVFVDSVGQLKSDSDYRRLKDRFGLRRTHAQFWQFSDRLHQYHRATSGIEFGLLDYNRLENR